MFASLADIKQYIHSYYFSVFKPWYFVAVLAMLSFILYVNYFQSFSIAPNNFLINFGADYCLYLFPFAAAYFLQYPFFGRQNYFKNKWFWWLLLLAPAFFSLRVNFNFHQPVIEKIIHADVQQYWLSVSNLLVRIFVLLFPVFIVWFIKNKNNQPFYGNKSIKNMRPYCILLAMMLPLLILASYQPAFIKKYPITLNAVTTNMPQKKWHTYFLKPAML